MGKNLKDGLTNLETIPLTFPLFHQMPDSTEKMVTLNPKISGSGTIIVGTGLIGKKRKR